MPSFSNQDWMKISQQIGDEFQSLSEAITLYRDEFMMKGINKGIDEWLKLQLANGAIYSDRVKEIIFSKKDELEKVLQEATNEITDIVENQINESYLNDAELKDRLIISLKNEINNNATLLFNNAVQSQKLIAAQVSEVIDYKSKTKDFYNAIEKYKTKSPINVVYSNGKQYKMSGYIEMKVRTTIQNTATEYLTESAKDVGVIFHLCNSLQDCADDHADFQGRVYVVKGWESIITDESLRIKVSDFIKKNNVQYLEDIVDGTIQWTNPNTKKSRGVYLTTRPNCRHFFRAVTIDEAIDYKNTLKNEKMENGKYDKAKYEALEQQRALERKIRDIKTKIASKKVEVKKTTDPATVSQINSDISKYNKDLYATQKELRELINKNSNLVRLPKRESIDPQGIFKR